MSGRAIRHVADLAQEWVEREQVQTLAALVACRGTIVLHGAWGRMAPEAGSPQTTLDAVFDTQSLGKVFTATAVLVLVEEGRVGLNRPVSSYVPFFRGEGKDAVLVRHLLTHSSGLISEDVERYVEEHEGKVEIPPPVAGMHPLWNEYFALRADIPLSKGPGEEMSYLSYGYELLGEIVRRVSGEPLDVFCQRRIFSLLGMSNTSCCQIDFPESRRVRGPPVPAELLDAFDRIRETERVAFGSGGAYTTPYDMAVFGQMLLNEGAYGTSRILSPATVRAMTRNQIPGVPSHFFEQYFPEASWGLGVDVRANKNSWTGGLESLQTFGHSGGGGIDWWVDPGYQIVGVLFSAVPHGTSVTTADWAKNWRNDLFEDAVTAAVVEV